MGLSLVRCPFCDRRYNVTGIPPGTKVLCTSCRTVLTVPGNRFVAPPPFWHRFVPRSGLAQSASAILGGLVLAAVCFVALKEAQSPPAVTTLRPDLNSPVAKTPQPASPDKTLLFTEDMLAEFHENPRFEVYASPELKPFVLVGEKDPRANLSSIFRKFEDLLPKLYRTFMKEFGDTLKLERIETHELPIVFYTKRKSYDAWWKSVYKTQPISEVFGVFSYLRRRVSLFYDISLENDDAGRSREVLLHEAIHQLVDHYTRRKKESNQPGAWWFQEGLGNYFEGYYATEGELTLTPGKVTSRLPLAREIVTTRSSEFTPLKKLIVLDVEAIWTDYLAKGNERERDGQVRWLQCAYAESWALVHFFCHAENGKYRTFFVAYFESELKGKGGWDEFDRLLNQHHPEIKDLTELEEQFKEYVRKL